MPELPEVETICKSLTPYLINKTIQNVTCQWIRSIAPQKWKTFQSQIIGFKIINILRYGKFIILENSSLDWIAIHLRMTGQLIVPQIIPKSSPHERMRFIFENHIILQFLDQRKFGRIWYIPKPDQPYFKPITQLGPDALDPYLTTKKFCSLIQTHKRQIKPLLLDQTIIAGLGNIYVDESLFLSQIHPQSLSHKIPRLNLQKLLRSIRYVLKKSITYQGTTFRDYRTARGEKGGFFSKLTVYGRTHQPCHHCHHKIIKIKTAQRGTHLCLNCQKLYN